MKKKKQDAVSESSKEEIKVVETEKKEKKVKVNKEEKKQEKKKEKENIAAQKKKIENKIDALVKDKKAAKDKDSKKDIKREIKKLKKERNEIGKKDTYLRDVKKEMSMVRWPSTKEIVKYSIASLVFVALFAVFFYGIDALFALVKDLIS